MQTTNQVNLSAFFATISVKRFKAIASILLVVLTAFICACRGAYDEGYDKATRDAKEAYLKMHLKNIREEIDKYTKEIGKPPSTMETLVDTGYLPMVPKDPMTDQRDWIPVYTECLPPPNCERGIKDVHSASKEMSSLGNKYSEW